MLRVACFGAGWVTTNRHIPTMLDHGGYEVAALVDRVPGVADAAARRLGLPRGLTAGSLAELDLAGEIDAVVVGVAPFGHHEIIREALEAGKHVLTEKPFTMSVAEGEELVALARERGLVVGVVHNFQFARSALKLRRWMEAGKIGRLRGVWGLQLSNPARRLPDWYDELPLGLFYDEAPHLFYLVRSLAGEELETVSATVHPSTLGHRTPAHVGVQLRAGQVPVTLQMSFEAPVSEWQVAVLGERALGIVDVFRDIAVRVPNDRDHRAAGVLTTSATSTLHHWAGYLRSGAGHLRGSLRYGNDEVFRRFHDAVNGGARPEGISGEDAVSVVRLMHDVVAAGAATAP